MVGKRNWETRRIMVAIDRSSRGMKDYDNLLKWRAEMKKLSPEARVAAVLVRYPKGTSIKGIQGIAGLGRGQKSRKKLDGILRGFEMIGFAKMYRAGNEGEVRL